jgi:hypothetical protein
MLRDFLTRLRQSEAWDILTYHMGVAIVLTIFGMSLLYACVHGQLSHDRPWAVGGFLWTLVTGIWFTGLGVLETRMWWRRLKWWLW